MKTSPETSCVLIQFSFPLDNMIPNGLNWIPDEDFNGRVSRKSQKTGFSILDRQTSVCLSPFVEDLDEQGFLMVSATIQCRVTKQFGQYNLVRFVFKHADELNRFEKNFVQNIFPPKSAPVEALKRFSRDYLWRVRGFSNPYNKNDQNDERRFWSINSESCLLMKNRKPANYLSLPIGESPKYLSREQFITRW